MSWLADFAGKAEDFLNKIDKNTATALNISTKNEKGGRPKKSEPFIEPNDPPQQESANLIEQLTTPTPTSGATFMEVKNGGSGVESNSRRNNSRRQSPSNKKPKNTLHSTDSSNISSASNPTSSKNVGNIISKSSNQNGMEDKKGTSTGNGSAVATPATEDELIEYLNSSEPSAVVNESLMLKDEVDSQARELKLITKNYKSLQLEHEVLKRKLEKFKKKLENEESARHSNETEGQDLRKLLEERDAELASLASRHQQALESIQKLELSQDNLQKLEQCLLDNSQLKSENETLVKRTELLSSQAETAETHVLSMKTTLSSMEKEFTNYKEKAKSILNYKDELIASLKNEDGSSSSPRSDTSSNTAEELLAEVTALKNERELLQADLSQTRASVESLKEDNIRLEKEVSTLRYFTEDISGQLTKEKETISSLQNENLQVCQQLTSLQFQLERERSELKKCEMQIAKYKESTSSNNSTLETNNSNGYFNEHSEREISKLKTRMNALSQSLYEKQSLINNISTDKQLLQIEVERLKHELRESRMESNDFCQNALPQTVIASQPLYLSESPWDSRVSARMKRIYTQIDAVFCQFGLALRKRPNLRLGMSVYVIFLHLWVFFVLFSWMHHAAPDA